MRFEKVFTTPNDGRHYYFGYYDKSPLSKDGTKLLALQVNFIDRLPGRNDQAIIGFFDLQDKNPMFRPVAKTKTFNWQQGCMLQWLGPDFNSKIIYNDIREDRFSSVIFDLTGNVEKILPMAVYAVFPNGQQALCIDNERHYWCRRGYSYAGIENERKKKTIVDNDGIFRLDFTTEKVDQIVGIEKMNEIKPLSTMKEGANYLEHIMINPSGSRFAFLHRWKSNGGIYSRLYTAEKNGSDLFLLNDSGRIGHFCWRNDYEILGWGAIRNPINSLRRYKIFAKYILRPLMPLYRLIVKGNSISGNSRLSRLSSGDSYLLFTDTSSKVIRVGQELLNKDGHPSFSLVNQDVFVTDTYPDSSDICNLMLYRLSSNTVHLVDQLATIHEYANSPLRCDLHPKWSFCGRFVCVDTMHEMRRGMYLYRIAL